MFLLYLAKTSWFYTISYRPISINHEWINIMSGEMHPKCWVYHTQKKFNFLQIYNSQASNATNKCYNVKQLMTETWHLASCCCSGAFVCHMCAIPSFQESVGAAWWVQTPANKKIEEICCLEKDWAETNI